MPIAFYFLQNSKFLVSAKHSERNMKALNKVKYSNIIIK